MKKHGFTLAEMMITLGIIGVVAALAAPTLVNVTQKAKVGPTLRKFVTTVENGNERILQEEDADVITEITGNTIGVGYLNRLAKYIKGERKTFNSAGDNDYSNDINIYNYAGKSVMSLINSTDNIFEFADGSTMYVEGYSSAYSKNPNGAYKGRVAEIYYDINGFSVGPNRYGKDVFRFRLDNTGTIIPKGGKLDYSAYTDQTEEQAWKDSSDKCNETTVGNGLNCAGAIADNNWKVTYKY